MPRRRSRGSRSAYPVSSRPPSKGGLPEPQISLETILERVERLINSNQSAAALSALETVPARFQFRPEVLLAKAVSLLQLGDAMQAENILDEVERKHPKYYPVYYYKAHLYLEKLWPAHAFRAARKMLASPVDDREMRAEVEELEEVALSMLSHLATELGIEQDRAEKASWYNERAQLFSDKAEFSMSEQMAREAKRLAPNWSPPRNNHALALYFSGRIEEAFAEAESVLEDFPDNLHALKNLALFHAGLNKDKEASQYGRRMLTHIADAGGDDQETDLTIELLALLGDDESLWTLGQRFLRKPATSLSDQRWYALGAAAARLKRWKEARKLLERATGSDHPAVESALHFVEQKGRSAWPPGYGNFYVLWPKPLMERWIRIAEGIRADEPNRSQQKEIDAYIERYPFALAAFKRMLWEEVTHKAALSSFILARRPEGYAEIERFGTSDCGPDDVRMQALFALVEAGQIQRDQTIRIWRAEEGEWREVQLLNQLIGEVEYEVSPEVAELVERAREEKDPPRAIVLLEEALKLDPKCAIAIHNLGITYLNIGEEEQGIALIHRSVEADPDYLHGYLSLAGLAFEKGDYEAAISHMDKISHAETLPPLVAVRSHRLWFWLALQKGEYKIARIHLDMLKTLDPDQDHHDHEDWESRLHFAELLGDEGTLRKMWLEGVHRAHEKLLNKPIAAQANLRECLDRVPREALPAACRVWGVSSAGRKQELIERLAAAILDERVLRLHLTSVHGKEREALRWIMEKGGYRPWREFIKRFGDDYDDSPYWQYHDPETIPGRLKMMGLMTAGTCAEEQVAFIPADLRAVLLRLLAEM